LLENALYHTSPDTRIDVRLRRSDSMAQLVVADTGPGIAAEHLPHIWDRFYRVDKGALTNARWNWAGAGDRQVYR
jgi:signal transduction histidine kinase